MTVIGLAYLVALAGLGLTCLIGWLLSDRAIEGWPGLALFAGLLVWAGLLSGLMGLGL